MEEQQKFQSQAQLIALKVHAVVERIYGVILFPFTWAAEQMGMTHVFRQSETQPALKAVK